MRPLFSWSNSSWNNEPSFHTLVKFSLPKHIYPIIMLRKKQFLFFPTTFSGSLHSHSARYPCHLDIVGSEKLSEKTSVPSQSKLLHAASPGRILLHSSCITHCIRRNDRKLFVHSQVCFFINSFIFHAFAHSVSQFLLIHKCCNISSIRFFVPATHW